MHNVKSFENPGQFHSSCVNFMPQLRGKKKHSNFCKIRSLSIQLCNYTDVLLSVKATVNAAEENSDLTQYPGVARKVY